MKTTMQIIKEELEETINVLKLTPEAITTKSKRLEKKWYSKDELIKKLYTKINGRYVLDVPKITKFGKEILVN